MDLLRSCYSTTMRFEQGGPAIPIRWFFTPKGTPMLPFGHTFASRNWEDEGKLLPDDGGVGEIRHAPRRWSIGRPGANFGYRHPDGPQSYYVGGPPGPGWTPIPLDPFTVPLDCVVTPNPGIVAAGGLGTDGNGGMSGHAGLGALSDGDLVMGGSTVFILEQQTQASLPAATNDYVLGGGTGYRVTASAPATVTGFSGGVDGRVIIWENFGPALISVADDSAMSLAGNRVYAIDGISTRIYPGMTAVWKYDGVSQRWREISSVPLVRQRGDLLTSTLTAPAVLTAGADTNVLTADSSQATGLKWAPAGGSAPDWFGWEPGMIGSIDYDRWQVGGFAVGDLVADVQVDRHVLYAMPLAMPQGGIIDILGVRVGIPNATPGAFAWLAVYAAGSPGHSYPTSMLGTEVQVSIDVPGNMQMALATPATVPAGSLVWLVLWSTGAWNGNCFGPGVGPTSYAWPIMGFSTVGQLKAGVGWYQGDPMMGGVDYTGGLPHGFPTPAAGVRVLGDVDVLNWPAIYAHRTH